MKKGLFVWAAVVCTGTSHAGVVLFASPGNFTGDENILFQQPGTAGFDEGLIVKGETSSSSHLLRFFDSTDPSSGNAPVILSGLRSSGQARLTASEVLGGPQRTFSNVTTELDAPDLAFKTLIVNVTKAHGAPNGSMQILVDLWGGGSVVFEPPAYPNILANGSNWFRLQATDGDWIKRVRYVSSTELNDFRQWRVGGIGDPTAIPAPAAALPFAIAVISRRRRRR